MRNKNLVFTIAGILALLAIFYITSNQNNPGSPGIVEEKKLDIVKGAPGTIPEGFPKDIMLNGKNGQNESYAINYPEAGAKQGTVEFDSIKTPAQNFEYYKKWAEVNGWLILNSSNKEPVFSLYLRKGSEDMNITIHDASVNISYLSLSR